MLDKILIYLLLVGPLVIGAALIMAAAIAAKGACIAAATHPLILQACQELY